MSEAQSIVANICKEYAKRSLRVESIRDAAAEKLTMGDSVLDKAIGGGIRTGMVWELAGER